MAFMVVGLVPILLVGAVGISLVGTMGTEATDSNKDIGADAREALGTTSEAARDALDQAASLAINASSDALTEQAEDYLGMLIQEKAKQSDSYMEGYIGITQRGVGILMDQELKGLYKTAYNGPIQENLTSAFVVGDFNGDFFGGIAGAVDGNFDGKFGDNGVGISGYASWAPSFPQVTFFTGYINAYVKGDVNIIEGVTFTGTYNGNAVTWTDTTETVDGALIGSTEGTFTWKDGGGTINGEFDGLIQGELAGSFDGTINANLDIQMRLEIDGVLHGTLDKITGLYVTMSVENEKLSHGVDSLYISGPDPWEFFTDGGSQFMLPTWGMTMFNSTKRGWYMGAAATKETFVTAPYVGAGDATSLMISVATPAYYDAAKTDIYGVYGADLTIQDLVINVTSITAYETGYGFLIDGDGHVMAVKGMDMSSDAWEDLIETEDFSATTNTDFGAVVAAMKAGQAGVATVDVATVESSFTYGPTTTTGTKYVAYAPITSTGWSLGIVVPEAEVLSGVQATQTELENAADQSITDIDTSIAATNTALDRSVSDTTDSMDTSKNSVIYTIIAILVLAIVIALVVGVVMASRMSKPINDLKNTANEIAGGKSDLKAEAEGTKEVQELATAFNQMNEANIHKLNNIKEFTEIIEQTTAQMKSGNIDIELPPESDIPEVNRMRKSFQFLVTSIRLITTDIEQDMPPAPED